METLVKIDKLSKRFGLLKAVDGVSLAVHRGDVLGFLGPNGAGKSTTMRMVTCYLAPTSGTAAVCGHDILKDPIRVREHIGYLPEGAPAYADMTPRGFLDFCAEVRGLSGKQKKAAVDSAIERVGLGPVARQVIDTLSKGFKRRVGLAQAILHDPDVLILDEPTDGLDPNQKHEVRTLIKEMASRKAIILSTHILEEVEAVCTRASIIARGRVIFDGSPDELEAKSEDHNAVTLTVGAHDAEGITSILKGLSDVRDVRRIRGESEVLATLRIYPKGGKPITKAVAEAARNNKWRVDEMRHERGRLDEVFRQLTTGSKEAA